MAAAFTLLGFLSGSIPFSLLIGRWRLGRDIRTVGDGNPGATNVLKAGGFWWFMAAGWLDGLKAAIPVAIAYWGCALRSWELVAIGLAPLLGHAFSPFLKGHGGKAVATTFGVWTGITGPEAPLVIGALLGIWYWALAPSGWALLAAMLCFGLHLLNYRPNPVLLSLWGLNTVLLIWKYRADLAQRPVLRVERVQRWFEK
jgi:glycerol-3-phosphate acyltransferase PlsY